MNDTDESAGDIWGEDLLGFSEQGAAFNSLIKSINDHRTISIEAGYGHGKTFFRERWAKQLEAAGECVILNQNQTTVGLMQILFGLTSSIMN